MKRCPHWWWIYNTHRQRRFCLLCAHQQRLDSETGRWVKADPVADAEWQAALAEFEDDDQ